MSNHFGDNGKSINLYCMEDNDKPLMNFYQEICIHIKHKTIKHSVLGDGSLRSDGTQRHLGPFWSTNGLLNILFISPALQKCGIVLQHGEVKCSTVSLPLSLSFQMLSQSKNRT